jgi:transcriptional regulator with XRE-family HTH domain
MANLPISFDSAKFAFALDTVRTSKRITWQQVAEQCKVSASTLSRIQAGNSPDADSLARLVAWGGLDFSKFINDRGVYSGE